MNGPLGRYEKEKEIQYPNWRNCVPFLSHFECLVSFRIRLSLCLSLNIVKRAFIWLWFDIYTPVACMMLHIRISNKAVDNS